MFDPEKVERIRGEHLQRIFNSGNLNLQWHDWVDSSDYDQLLELYRKLQHEMNMGMNDARQAAAMNYGQR